MMWIVEYKDVDDSHWQFWGEYATKAEAAEAAYSAGDYPYYYITRVRQK